MSLLNWKRKSFKFFIPIILFLLQKCYGQSLCGSTLNFIACPDDPERYVVLSRHRRNEIKAIYIPGRDCQIAQTSFHWSLLLANGSSSIMENFVRDTFFIEPYQIGYSPEPHHILLVIFELYKNTEETGELKRTCIFEIKREDPVPIIKGGIETTCKNGRDIILDGSDSIDNEVPRNSKKNLKYKWTCTVNNMNLSPFCKENLGTGPVLKIPAKYALQGLIYVVTLSVKSLESNWHSVSQTVYIIQGAASIEIKCENNCPPLALVTNVKQPTILTVDCKINCENIDSKLYKWTIDDEKFSYDTNTKFGREGSLFFINNQVLVEDKIYLVSVEILDKKGKLKGKTAVHIKTHSPPKFDKCFISPKSGESLKTYFIIFCSFKKGQYMFEVYSIKKNSKILLDRNAVLGNIQFIVPAEAKVLVILIDEYQFSGSVLLDVDVKNSMQYFSNPEELKSHFNSFYLRNYENYNYYSVQNLLITKEYDQIIQLLSIFLDEFGSYVGDFITSIVECKNKMLDSLSLIPLESVKQATQVASLAKKIGEDSIDKQDPNIATKATDLCLKATQRALSFFNKERYQSSFREEIEKDGHLFLDCAQIGNSKNVDLLIPEKVIDDPTTPFPLLEMAVITEDYPNYEDDEIVSKVKKKFERCGQNLVDICLANNLLQTTPISPYEDEVDIKTDTIESKGIKKFGKDLPELRITLAGADLKPSKDFLGLGKSVIKVLICVDRNNPFSSLSEEKIETSIVILQFYSNNVVTSFYQPFTLTFTDINLDQSTLTIHEGVAPRKSIESLLETDKNFEEMLIFRIDVFRKQSYFIEFSDLNPQKLYTIYVTEFYKPNRTEFKLNSKRVTSEINRLFIENNKDYDHWDYLTIMPEDGKSEIKVNFKVYTLSCYSWQPSTRQWIAACGSSKNSNFQKIECTCYHASTMGGVMKNNPVKEEHTQYSEHQLESRVCYIIFLTVLVTWILYCGFLSYFSFLKKQKPGKEVYFLSDVPSYYRFGYIIIIKTGDQSNAGTTSNVFIKLHGKNADSKEHVLNYPDPEKRILQRSQEDWFFLATEFYLGDIEKLDIWFDSTGARPAWFCSEIEVVDLQHEKYWWFTINFQFEIKDYESYVYSALPDVKDNISKRQLINKECLTYLEGIHMWNVFSPEIRLSKIKRLTIMLSIFMTTFAIMLLAYGLPVLNKTDSLDQYYKYRLYWSDFWTSLTISVFTFAIHFPIVHLFRVWYEKMGNSNLLKIFKLDINQLCWCALIFLIMTSMTITLVFGFWVPHGASLLWLTSSIGSLLLYGFFLENVDRIYRHFFLRKKSRLKEIVAKKDSILQYVEIQRRMYYDMFGKLSMRPYFNRVYKLLDNATIKDLKYWAKQKENLLEIVDDIITIGLYVIFLYIVILKDKDPMTTFSNEEIHYLVKGMHSKTHSEYIANRAEINDYIEKTLIPSLQSMIWYGRYIKNDPGNTIDNTNKYAGIVRLRQQRSDNFSCYVEKSMRFLQNNCISAYSEGPEYRSFSEKWGDVSESDHFARMDPIWKYQGVSVTGTYGYVGHFGTYSGGGFVATLGRTLTNSLINCKYLNRNNWLDERTRCLFIEFLTYSTNSNLFNAVKIIFEISLTGYVRSVYKVRTARLLLVQESGYVTLWIVFIVFISILIIFTLKLAYRMGQKRNMLFKNVWLFADILIVSLTFICAYLYFKRSQAVKTFLEDLERARHNEFIKYFHLFHAEVALTSLAALLIFLATLRLWKLLRFLVIIRVVEKTLILSIMHLFCLFILHFHMLIVFTIGGFLLFGDQSIDFKNFFDSLTSLILASLGFLAFDYDLFSSPLHYVYYCLYMIFNLIVLNLYIVLINIKYAEAQLFYSNLDEYNVVEYVKDQYSYYKELAKVRFKKARMKGGQDKNVEQRKAAYPKSDEHRYAKSLTIEKTKMDAMRKIALNCIRNMKETTGLTEKDVDLINRTIVDLFKENKNADVKDFFFLGDVQGYKTILIDDMRFLKMENIINELLINKKETKQEQTVLKNNQILFDRIHNNLEIILKGLECCKFDDE